MNERLKFAREQRQNHPFISADNRIHRTIITDDFGFGYEWNGKEYLHIPHTGNISIGVNVTIHAGTSIVKGTANNDITVISDGTKIDFGVQIAHNCKIGKHNLIHAGVVICGSVQTGDHCIIGANTVINRKYKIGNNVEILPLSWVCQDLPDNSTWGGNPLKRIK
jgi:UDP-3-O-[3-hydroxymyristoyl] glucosamine N-acyltransferase